MNNTNNQIDINLEPRVAKLEVGLDRLTEDVRSLASIVRDQGATVEKQLSELTVAVTQAAGPRKTDWSTIISAILLIMTIGSAVFFPLNQLVQENKIAVENLSEFVHQHEKLDIHPVGNAILNRMERELENIILKQEKRNEDDVNRLKDELQMWRLKAMGVNTFHEEPKQNFEK
jgi:hypothetical protein